MSESLTLPLATDALPQKIRRFAATDAPKAAKGMAAKGLVPVKGADMLSLLVQLSADAEDEIAAAAKATLSKMPENILFPALETELHPAFLHALPTLFPNNEALLEKLVLNHRCADATIADVAKTCSEEISEIVALNQQRLLGAPQIIEALYMNPNTRMSTADRLIEFAARNELNLSNIPAFEAHVAAIQGQLIPEPTEEPLPDDGEFRDAVDLDSNDHDTHQDDEDGKEEVKSKFVPLQFRIMNMNLAGKIRLAMIGDAAARSILVRDPNRLVCTAAIASPKMTEREAGDISQCREVSDDILRYISNKKKWMGSYEMKRNLVFNPKSPLGVSMKWLSHMRPNDLKILSKSRGIPGSIKTAAKQQLAKRQKKRS